MCQNKKKSALCVSFLELRWIWKKSDESERNKNIKAEQERRKCTEKNAENYFPVEKIEFKYEDFVYRLASLSLLMSVCLSSAENIKGIATHLVVLTAFPSEKESLNFFFNFMICQILHDDSPFILLLFQFSHLNIYLKGIVSS